MTRDKALVMGVELWFPQGDVMGFGAGAYRGSDELRVANEGACFNPGEGLPGAVWTHGRALLWEASKAAWLAPEVASRLGVDAAVGCPLFDGGRLFAVLTLLLSRRGEAPGCLEVWDVAGELDVLKYGQGYYVNCAEVERFSSLIQFPRGTGLPGLTWLGEAQVMADVRQSNSFIRAGLAANCGLKHGLGWPVYRDRKVIQVLTLFSAEQGSFMGGAEIYYPHGSELGAAMLFDWSGRGSTQGESSADAAGRELAKRVMRSGLPALSQARVGSGHEISLALPLYDRKSLKQIVVLRLR